MKSRYLCKKHFQLMCQDLAKAEQFWHHTMALGLDAINSKDQQQAERCFGAAYETANIILDRQISRQCDTEIATNTLLSAQYLMTTLIKLGQDERAEVTLSLLHKKFLFLSRHNRAALELREILCNCLIPYIEKLYNHALDQQVSEQSVPARTNQFFDDIQHLDNSPKSTYCHNGSTLYH